MNPRRGEIWLADLNPTIGAEIRKVGDVPFSIMNLIVTAIAAVIEYVPILS